MTDVTASVNLNHALMYAKNYGWKVFPVFGVEYESGKIRCSCGRGFACGEEAGKHPGTEHGFKDASGDEAQIRAWWTARPNANIGIACGEESGFFVVDVDVKKGDGVTELARWWGEYGEFPETLAERSASGGAHYFFQWPKDGLGLPSRPGWLPSVDVLCNGRYVIVSPSQTPKGSYAWLTSGIGPAYPPQLLLDGIRAGTGSSSSGPGFDPGIDDLVFLLNGPEKGKRNETFYHFALKWLRIHRGDEKIVGGLLAVAYGQLNDKDEFSPEELARSFKSAIARYRTYQDEDAEIGKMVAQWQKDLDSGDAAKGSGKASEPIDVSSAYGGLMTAPDGFPLTDHGNGQRLMIRHGARMKHTTGLGWHVWDGTRWNRDDAEKTISLNMDTIIRELLVDLVPKLVDRGVADEVVKAVMRHWRVSETPSRVRMAIASCEYKLSAKSTGWDAEPFLFNVANGTVDLRTGELRPHSPDDMLTKMSGARYDADAKCPHWMRFVERVLPDPALRMYVQKAVGYTLGGGVDEKCLFMLYGGGDNGKTIFTETLGLLLNEYWHAAPKSVFIGYGSKQEQHPTDLASIAGARYVTCSEEVRRGDHLAESRIKSMTGGNTMTARFMHQDFFEFSFMGKLWLDTNYKPRLTDFSSALQERIHLVPWVVEIPREERRPRAEMLGEFAGELSGILNWALAGALEWAESGLKKPQAVVDATAEYIHEENLVAQFAEDYLEAGGFTPTKTLVQAYEWWMSEQGMNTRGVLSGRSLGVELRRLGYEDGRDRNGARGWTVSLKMQGSGFPL